MSRPVKHRKTGVYWFRKRVPADIAALTGRKEAIRTLGTKDPEEAKRKYAEVIAEFEREWARIRLRGAFDGGDANRETEAEDREHTPRLITDREAHVFAQAIHDEWLAKFRDNPSEQLHWHTELYEGMWTKYPLPSIDPLPGMAGIADALPGRMPIENVLWQSMRAGCLSRAKDILAKNSFSDDPWSIDKTARAVGAAYQRASLTLQRLERGELEWDVRPVDDHSSRIAPAVLRPLRTEAKAVAEEISLVGLVEAWWKEAKSAGRKPSTYDSYRNAFSYLAKFLKHDDATKVTTKDVIAFKNHRLSTPSPKTGKMVSAKTVKDSNLSALKVVFEWGVVNGLLSYNPATGVTLKLAKPARTRSKGFSDDEAKAILSAALAHDRGQESWKTFQAKRWIPWLCAFTGARVGELAQLRKQDVFQRDGTWIIHITPEAGTVKTNEARDVPLHQQLIDLGFPTFVQEARAGHLFLNVDSSEYSRGARRGLKNRLAEFGRAFVPDPKVAPNHGWRHRFKTIGMEAGIPPRILDAIQGQVPRTVAETYGEVTLKTMVIEIAKLPRYSL